MAACLMLVSETQVIQIYYVLSIIQDTLTSVMSNVVESTTQSLHITIRLHCLPIKLMFQT